MNGGFMKKTKTDYSNPAISNKKSIEKDKHHISWKNHNTDNYIKESLKNYLKNQEKNV